MCSLHGLQSRPRDVQVLLLTVEVYAARRSLESLVRFMLRFHYLSGPAEPFQRKTGKKQQADSSKASPAYANV